MAQSPERKTEAAWVSIRLTACPPCVAASARYSKTSCWFSAVSLICRNSACRRQPWRPKWRGQNAGLTAHLAAIKAYNAEHRESGSVAEMPMRGKDNIRTAAEILVDQLQ